jgi:hypothetical protein
MIKIDTDTKKHIKEGIQETFLPALDKDSIPSKEIYAEIIPFLGWCLNRFAYKLGDSSQENKEKVVTIINKIFSVIIEDLDEIEEKIPQTTYIDELFLDTIEGLDNLSMLLKEHKRKYLNKV